MNCEQKNYRNLSKRYGDIKMKDKLPIISQFREIVLKYFLQTEQEKTPTGTILEPYFALFGGRYIFASLLAAGILFILGLVISVPISFFYAYLTSPPIYLALFGIAWVGSWIGSGTRQIQKLINDIRPAFMVSDDAYEQKVKTCISWIFNNRIQWLFSVIYIFIGWGLLCYYNQKGLLPWFHEVWSSEPHLFAKNVILALYCIPIAILLFISTHGIIIYLCSVYHIFRLPLVPNVKLARVILKPLSSFSLRCGLAWSIGIVLLVLLFQPEFYPFAVTLVSGGTLLGLIFIAWPEYATHKALENLRHEILFEAANRMRLLYDLNHADLWENFFDEVSGPSYGNIYMAVEATLEARSWNYGFRDVLGYIGFWALPIVSQVALDILRQTNLDKGL